MGAPPVKNNQWIARRTRRSSLIQSHWGVPQKLQRLGLSLAAAASGASCLVTVVLVASVLCCSAASLALLVHVLQETLGNLGAP